MEIISVFPDLGSPSPLDEFVEQYHSRGLTYLASDLILRGVEPGSIVASIRTSIEMAGAGGIDPARHFKPVYSYSKGILYRDCKLSLTGWNLVLLNLRPEDPATARIKLEICDALARL